MRVPQIIELLDMSEQTLQKVDGCLLFDFAFDNCTVLYCTKLSSIKVGFLHRKQK